MEQRVRHCGVPVRQLSSVTNKHSCRFDLLTDAPGRTAETFMLHLAQDPSWDVLKISEIPEGGNAWRLVEPCRALRLPFGVWNSSHSPYLALPESYEAWAAQMKRTLKPLRRRRRRLEERGQVRIDRVRGAASLAQALREGFALESRGWKGERGTAILQDERTVAFYTELMELGAERGWLDLYFLRLDDQPIAFQMGLRVDKRYLAMKPAYDEAFHEFSPGQLLMEELVGQCARDGLTEVDLLGDESVAKRLWTDRTRAHGWLFVYRRSWMGRALRSAKFRWAPAAKQVVKRWVRTH
jgi:CelD/BcsL family acetyltransferase involved in cellulose biosynthesis